MNKKERSLQLNAEIQRLEKAIKNSAITGVLFLILFFPIGIGVFIYGASLKKRSAKLKQELSGLAA